MKNLKNIRLNIDKVISIIFLILVSGWIITGCSDEPENGIGTVSLSLTDSPIDAENVESVVVTIAGIEFKKEDEDMWEQAEGFGDPQSYDLLTLTEGNSVLLGNFNAGAGVYTGLRFILDAPLRGSNDISNPGSFLKYKDGSEEPLFVPSGDQTGIKSIGSFTVPVNGTVEVTTDFDVRKSVVEAGQSGIFILKPVLRIIVNNQAGEIQGTVSNLNQEVNYVIYAYEDGTYNESEDDDPETETVRFPNAVTSNSVEDDGSYTLAFLAPTVYDLVIASFDSQGAFLEVAGVVENVSVESNQVTTEDIDLNTL